MLGAVEVITTTEGRPVPPVDAGLCVITEVIRTTDGEGGEGAADDGGPEELVGTTTVGAGTAEEEGGKGRKLV